MHPTPKERLYSECTGTCDCVCLTFVDAKYELLKLERATTLKLLNIPSEDDEPVDEDEEYEPRKKELYNKLLSCVKCDRNYMLEPRDQFNWIERRLVAVKQHLSVDEILDAIKVCVLFHSNIFLERGSESSGRTPGRGYKSLPQAPHNGSHGASTGQGSEEARIRSDGVYQDNQAIINQLI